MIVRALLACFALALTAGLTACGGRYQLGPGSDPGFATLHVAIVRSDTMVPQSTAVFTTAIRAAFLKDGRVRLVDRPDEADAILRITLTDYGREMTVAQPTDTGLARRYDVTLSAIATLTDQRDGRPLLTDRPLVARRGVFSDGGNVQAEAQTLPLLAERLAEETLRAVLDRW